MDAGDIFAAVIISILTGCIVAFTVAFIAMGIHEFRN